MTQLSRKLFNRVARGIRARVKFSGTKERPRLSVFRSLQYTSVQLIDDVSGVTLASAHDKELKDKKGTKTERAGKVGELIAEKAKALGITTVVFDKSSYKYHGRVKAVADGARAGGLVF